MSEAEREAAWAAYYASLPPDQRMAVYQQQMAMYQQPQAQPGWDPRGHPQQQPYHAGQPHAGQPQQHYPQQQQQQQYYGGGRPQQPAAAAGQPAAKTGSAAPAAAAAPKAKKKPMTAAEALLMDSDDEEEDAEEAAAAVAKEAARVAARAREDAAQRARESALAAMREDEERARNSNVLEIGCNRTTMGLTHVLYTHIKDSDYLNQELKALKTFDELMDELYAQTYHLEPYMASGTTTPSTAFVILFRLFQMKLTRRQVQRMVNYKDAPYIRGMGLLYLRYVVPARTLWDWFEPLLDDEEVMDPVRRAPPHEEEMDPEATVGLFARHLLTDQHYYGIQLPRIPQPVQKAIQSSFVARDGHYEAVRSKKVSKPTHDKRGVNVDEHVPAREAHVVQVASEKRPRDDDGDDGDASGDEAKRPRQDPAAAARLAKLQSVYGSASGDGGDGDGGLKRDDGETTLVLGHAVMAKHRT